MAKNKLGLQKEVSKIFTGIHIPRKDAAGPNASSTSPVSPVTPHTQAASAVTSGPVTPAAQVIPSVLVATSATVPAVTAPVSAVPAPVATPEKTVTPKPAVVPPKPFTIPEPPSQAPPQPTRQVVYEPPKPRQTISAPASLPVSTPAKQSKSELVIKQLKDSPLLKIIDKVKAKLLTSKAGAASGRQKMMILLSPVLAIVLLFVVVNAVKTPNGTSVAPSNKANAAAAAVSGSKINWEIPQPIPANLRNPMVFGAASASGSGTAEGPAVKGIVYSADKPSAIIGDRIVSVGDTVAGATIVKINSDSVDFAAGDKKWTQKVER
jgi:hypothetical protein